MVNLRKLLLTSTTLAFAWLNYAESVVDAKVDLSSPSQTEQVAPPSDSQTKVSDDKQPISKLTNDELIVKLNDINEMSSTAQRELLIEIQRRILKEGPEPFIKGRKDAITEATDPSTDNPKLEDQPIKIVTTEVRSNAAEEFVRDPEKANVKKTGESQKKPVPYGSAYSE